MELSLGESGAFSLVKFPETKCYNNPRLAQPSCFDFLKFFRRSDLPPKMSLFLQYTTICTERWKIKTYIGRNNTEMFVKIFLLLETSISGTPLRT